MKILKVESYSELPFNVKSHLIDLNTMVDW